MAMSDEKRAVQLAELARHFYLWLEKLQEEKLKELPELKKLLKEVPELERLIGLAPEQFHMLAGIYRKVEEPLGPRVVRFWDDPDEERRLLKAGKDVKHVLLFAAPDTIEARLPWGEGLVHENEILHDPRLDLTVPGSVVILYPTLDSRVADADILGLVRYYTFAGFFDKVDLVWDDLAAADRAGFDTDYRWIFGEERPRGDYEQNIDNVTPIDNDVPVKEFREYLYRRATYRERSSGSSGGDGDYYRKWAHPHPREKQQREHRPTKLTDDYIKDTFYEYVLQKNESYLLVELPDAMIVLQLRLRPKKRGARPELEVIPVLRFFGQGGRRSKPAEPAEPTDKESKVAAVLFHALDGNPKLPPLIRNRNRMDLNGSSSGRYAYNYKAAVRSFYGPDYVRSDDDEDWFNIFVDTFFGDLVYPVNPSLPHSEVGTWSAPDLLRLAEGTDGAVKARLEAIAAKAKHLRFAVKGTMLGSSEAKRRQLIGISSWGIVYEWHPETSLVTWMKTKDWLLDNHNEKVYAEVHEGSKGVIPFAMVVSFGGIIVAGAAIAGGLVLGNLAREYIIKLITDKGTEEAANEALRRLRPLIIAVFADGLVELLPKTEKARYEFLRGFLHGFGTGAIEHWFQTVDDRLEKQATRLYKKALNKASRGVYRAHQIYLKLSAAYHHLVAIYQALQKVKSDKLAMALARALSLIAQRVGLAFLILLFLVIYVDRVMANADKKKSRDKWAKEQSDVLQFMIKETGVDIAAYAESLHAKTSSAELVRERNERIARRLASAIADDSKRPPVVAEVLKGMLAELGIKDWEKLTQDDVFRLLAEGVDEWLLRHPGLVDEAVYRMGAATGTFVGTLFLERALLSAKWRERLVKKSPAIGGAVSKTLAGGSTRALWTMVRQSLDALREAAKRAVGAPPSAASVASAPFEFEHSTRSDAIYRETFQALNRYDRKLDESLSEMAGNADLATRIRAVVARAQTEAPPSADAWQADPAGWPPDAMSFILDCWMRIALDLAMSAFTEMDDATPFDGKFRIATLLEMLGLDVSLDDPAVTAARVEFERRGPGFNERFDGVAGTTKGTQNDH